MHVECHAADLIGSEFWNVATILHSAGGTISLGRIVVLVRERKYPDTISTIVRQRYSTSVLSTLILPRQYFLLAAYIHALLTTSQPCIALRDSSLL
jgi:hypothetical protein